MRALIVAFTFTPQSAAATATQPSSPSCCLLAALPSLRHAGCRRRRGRHHRRASRGGFKVAGSILQKGRLLLARSGHALGSGCLLTSRRCVGRLRPSKWNDLRIVRKLRGNLNFWVGNQKSKLAASCSWRESRASVLDGIVFWSTLLICQPT